MKYLSTTLLNHLYEQTESQLNNTISEWQQLPARSFSVLNLAPAMGHRSMPGTASTAMCRYYLPAIERRFK